MRIVGSLLLGLALAVALVIGLQAADEKETTLKGTITCGKCDLKKDKDCATVIVVKEKDKDVIYYFDTDAHKKYHDAVCTEPKKGKVTGKVAEVDKKKTIKVSKVEYDK